MKKISITFYITLVAVALAVGYGVIAPKQFEGVTTSAKNFIADSFGWYYLLIVSMLFFISIFLIFSPIGRIRLGKDHDRPQFSMISWLAMLFSAGMGIGLVFYGAAEPLSHYAVDPATAAPETKAAYKEAMRETFFHWGFHAWAVYGMTALTLAYFQFRKGQTGLISVTLRPIFGDRVDGRLGIVIDGFAIFATVFGVATSLGFGAVQINAGLHYLFGIPVGFVSQLAIIAIVTVLFLISAWSGLGKGIKILSNTNMVLALALLLFIIALGPTLLIFNMFTDSIGGYLENLIRMSFRTAPLTPENRVWLNDWTLFYWAWWMAWSPFVGMFIARVSKGRTIREFMIGVLVVPTVLSAVWFAAFGTTAIETQRAGIIDLASTATELTIFEMFSGLPWSSFISGIAILLIISFFITSADSATFVLGMQSSYGSLTPPNNLKIIWGVIQSSIAVILLFVGGLDALQNVIIIAALPFSIILIMMVVSLFKSLKEERKKIKRP
ncbi:MULTISPECIES: BCCT family transporter [unclassified Sporosarcina]|uniref:glycine betaine uptake BCCT transporter n=1 Tax=unclassified Sporosarcina TaxID=2647733 RepID=UPI00204123F4|nr:MULTISPECIES: BCCT family transporter [unclassified Sporosarcina]GKV64391.1 glycine betaine transporter OpuD [Sporosarcina sp. NCCP-2331]GLB55136.1 glycine betaine transporter OpuD [Sporosarcina sp. NCCP-2378]